jgi:hypothetical protein
MISGVHFFKNFIGTYFLSLIQYHYNIDKIALQDVFDEISTLFLHFLSRQATLYANLEAMVAAWAVNRVLPLDFWQAQLLAAVRAFFVNMRFSVTELVAPELKKAADPPKKAAECKVLTLTPINVFRKETEGRKKQQCDLNNIDNQAADKQICDHQGNRRPYQHMIQAVHAIAAVHHPCKLHSKSSHTSSFPRQFPAALFLQAIWYYTPFF